MARQALNEMLRLDDKAAIVTGAAKGIGRGIAERLAEAGAQVTIADIDEAAGRQVAGEAGADFHRADMTSESDLQALVASVVERRGAVDILVNNAGIYPFKPAVEMTAEEWDRVQAINLRGLFLLSREFARVPGSGGDRAIVNIGSIDALHPSAPGLTAYDASKGGVLMFTRAFALEAAPLGIRVNMIAPGGITTEGVAAAREGMPPDLMREFLSRIPLGRWGEPDDIARMALVLASPLSAYVTGAVCVVDGGRLLT